MSHITTKVTVLKNFALKVWVSIFVSYVEAETYVHLRC